MRDTDEDFTSLTIYNLLVEKTIYRWDGYSSIIDYLKNQFSSYHKHVMALKGYAQRKVLENHEISVSIQQRIFETVFHYLRGEIPAAYDSMKMAFELTHEILIRKSVNGALSRGHFVFKARVKKDNAPQQILRKDMFHIPFEKRHLVADQRFSAHGIPSVYLGESIYDCYLELGKPNLDNFLVSLFHIPPEVKLIDLTFSNHKHDLWLLLHQTNKDNAKYFATLDKLVDDFLLWPLIMACSIVCRYPEAPFKQEYIVPQMLYQLCNTDTGFNGIKYYSTKIPERDRSKLQNVMINYALPAQDIKNAGYCPFLSGRLCLTDPINHTICKDQEVQSSNGYTSIGFPIMNGRLGDTGNENFIVSLDRMSMYFTNALMDNYKNALKPLYEWAEE